MTTNREKDRVYWDSCVFIDLLQPSSERIDILDEYINLAEQGQIDIVTSDFTLCEVAKLRGLPLSDDDVEEKIVDFFDNPYILLRSLDRRVSTKTREIMRAVNIKGKDAIHVATAALTGVRVFYTYDGPLQRLAPAIQMTGKVLDNAGNPLSIEEPVDPRPPILTAIEQAQ